MMAAAWFNGLKRSMTKSFKAESSDIVQRSPMDGSDEETRKPFLSRSRSLSNHRDVVPGRNQTDKSEIDSRRSIGSHQNYNPVTHRVELSLTDSKGKLKIIPCDNDNARQTLYNGGRRSFSLPKNILSKARRSFGSESRGFVCQKCGKNFVKLEDIESHHLSMHAVSPLPEKDLSKKILESNNILELICKTNLLETESKSGHTESILNVHNLQISLALFENYREKVKLKASKRSNRHPRCVADGNELLRFYGTTVACTIGMKNTSTGLCTSDKCGVCCILRHGFCSKEHPNGFRGIFTSSTSKRAFERIGLDEENRGLRKALLVCRVIAGRVYTPGVLVSSAISSFDSVAANADRNSDFEELYSLHPGAVLPCFLVIYKPR